MFLDSQSDGPVGQQAAIRRFSELLFAAADPFPQRLDAVRFGPLVRAAAAAGGGEQAGAALGEPRLGGGQQEQHQDHTPEDANAGSKHCQLGWWMSPQLHPRLQSSHISTMKPSGVGGKRKQKGS